MRETRLRANGLDFRALEAGPREGPPVLLLHGFPEGAESWTTQLEALGADGFHVLAPDLRGYGGSDCPEGVEAYALAHLNADVEGLVNALGHRRCHLAGHDWGAIIGWSFVSRHPGRVQTWSALSVPHPAAFRKALEQDPEQAIRSAYIGLFRTPVKAEAVLAENGLERVRQMFRGGPNPEAVPESVVARYLGDLARPGRLSAALNYYRANLSGEAQKAYPPAPHPISTPTQMIWGDGDPALGRRGIELTEAEVGGEYRLGVLEGAGHWLQFDRPAEVSALLADWMSSHEMWFDRGLTDERIAASFP